MKLIITGLLLFACALLSCDKSSDSSLAGSAATVNGANGSLTRFITVGSFLYIVDQNNLKAYDISNAIPVLKNSTAVGFNIETLFEFQGNLFIGSNNAIFIYSLANPQQPVRVSQFNYFIPGRDPVVAVDSVAYSTTRNLNGPGGSLNIVNIKNLQAPVGVGAIGLTNPYGLAINGSALYVCNGSNGISVYNRTNAYAPVLVQQFSNGGETFYDLIVRGNIMICYIRSGIVILDVSNPVQPVFISKIKF